MLRIVAVVVAIAAAVVAFFVWHHPPMRLMPAPLIFQDLAVPITDIGPALADGAQIVRYASSNAGLLVTSRIADGQEYVVVANNSLIDQSEQVTIASRGTSMVPVFGGGQAAEVDADGNVTVSAEPLSVRVYRVESTLPARDAAPTATIEPVNASRPELRVPLEAGISEDVFAEVSFLIRPAAGGDWQLLGTDDAPNSNTGRYRVFARRILSHFGFTPQEHDACCQPAPNDR